MKPLLSSYQLILTGLLLCLAPHSAASAAGATQPPNIVLIFIDDMGWGDFSCFGNREITTENFDRLAAEGLRFEHFYVNSPICSPSRVAISTGQYPQRWQITSYLAHRKSNIERGIAQWLDPSAPMLARLLKQRGYATGHFGKWHMGGQRDVAEAPLISEYGFDQSLTNFEGLGPRVLAMKDAYDGRPPQPHALGSDNLGRGQIVWQERSLVTQTFTSAAMAFIQQARAQNQPFYINLWPDDVHSPFFPPKHRRGNAEKKTLYHGVLDTADEQIGELLDYIRNNRQLRENTLVLVCSDNGPELGAGSAGNLRGYKTHLFEGGIRSPLIVWGPGLLAPETAGQVNAESVLCAMDLVPSILSLVDLRNNGESPSATPNFDGEVMTPTLLGKSKASRMAPIFFRRPPDRDRFYGIQNCPDLAVRYGKWKLLCEYDGSLTMLYDLSSDPSETKDVALEHQEIVSDLRNRLLEWHGSMPADNGPELAAN